MTSGSEASGTVCAHCGLPAPSATGGSDEAFCCNGCFLAFHLSASGGRAGADPLLARLVLSACLAMGVMVFSLSLYGEAHAPPEEGATAVRGFFRLGALALSTPILWLLGLPLAEGVVTMRRWFSTEALVLLGTLAAWFASVWSTLRDGANVWYETAAMVLVLFTLGRWLDARAREKAHGELRLAFEEAQAPYARIASSGEVSTRAEELRVGDLVRVRPGEILPVDGVVRFGRSFVDTASMTGEETARAVGPGEHVLAGSSLVDGSLEVEVTAAAGSRVRDEVERALNAALAAPPRLVRVADRVAAVLLPIVVLLAASAVLSSWNAGAEEALLRGLSVALIACPCALGVATPLAYWVALGAARRRGAVVRGGSVFERLARVRRVFLDKTGTLTRPDLELTEVVPLATTTSDEALRLAAMLEAGSEHPIARAIRAAVPPHVLADESPHDFRVLSGQGVQGTVAGRPLRLVRASEAGRRHGGATVVQLEHAGQAIAEFVLRAELRADAAEVVRGLARRGLAPEVLTGDGNAPAARLASELDVPVHAELLPTDKVRRVLRAGPEHVAFVGDGVNDAAAIAAADVGIAVRGASPMALRAADIALLNGDLGSVPALVDLARSATRTARGNLVWAFAYNSIGLWLAFQGLLTPVFAASAMVVSSLFVVLNTARLARWSGATTGGVPVAPTNRDALVAVPSS